jgi:hypothetical protein
LPRRPRFNAQAVWISYRYRKLDPCQAEPVARDLVDHLAVIEAEVDDADGTIVHLLVHVVDGFLHELEIFREDSNPVRREISPESLRLLVL